MLKPCEAVVRAANLCREAVDVATSALLYLGVESWHDPT